jgi:ABC-2 type transport system permease protein
MAAIITASAASLLAGLLGAAGLARSGLDAPGSMALGLAVAATGWVFTGIGALTAQLTESGRSANAIGVAVIGASFLLRMAGDAAQSDVVAWFTPLGWAQAVRPFAGNRWWVLTVPTAAALVLAFVGYRLSNSRDVGAGLIQTRSGPADAGSSLASPLGLAWRLHRGILYGWLTGYAIIGVVIGSLANAFGQIASDSPEMADIVKRIGGAAAISDAFLAAIFGLFALIASGYSIQVILRLRSEETDRRADPILAGTVSRRNWVSSHVIFATAGPIVILLVAGLATGIAYGVSLGEVRGTLGSVLGGVMVHLPAVWMVAGLALALDGLVPRVTAAMWAVLGFLVIVTLFGPAFRFPQWLLDVSPFTHIPKLPGGMYSATPETILLVAALALLAAGFAGMGRRDIE